jgi:hypothetical protein
VSSVRLVPRLAIAALAFTLVTAAAAAPAEAQRGTAIDRPFTGQRPYVLDLHAGFTWWGVGLAAGMRFGVPLVHNGFVPTINNAVYLNFGFDFYWTRWRCAPTAGGCGEWEYGTGLGFPIALQWNFYFNDQWSLYLELGGQIYLSPGFFNDGIFYGGEGGYWFIGALGVNYRIDDTILLTVRLGTPYASFGVGFQF